MGSIEIKNVQPFSIQFYGTTYLFMHNGTLPNSKEIPSNAIFSPLGNSDSEIAFCYLMGVLQQYGRGKFTPESFARLYATMKCLNEFGTFNCIFTNGTYLVVYADMKNYKDTMISQVGDDAVLVFTQHNDSSKLVFEAWANKHESAAKNGGQLASTTEAVKLTLKNWGAQNYMPGLLNGCTAEKLPPGRMRVYDGNNLVFQRGAR